MTDNPSSIRIKAARLLRNMPLLLAVAAVAITGCKDRETADEHGHGAQTEAAAPVTNRIDIPESVRRNLGITFARVENRRVTKTLRVPGRFELLPSARREYRTVLPARVELLVAQYDRVEAGQVLAKLDSPDWRKLQHEAVEAEGEIKVAEAGIDVADAAVVENQTAIDLLDKRVSALDEAGAPQAELTADLALARSKSARLAAEARAARVKLAEANEHYTSKLRTLAAVLGTSAERLSAPTTRPAGTSTADEPTPYWRTIESVEIRASRSGVVESLAITNDGWAEASGLLLTIIDPAQIRFRGIALQADLPLIRDGGAAEIIAPGGQATLPGRVSIPLEASADLRTLDLVVTSDTVANWSRPGVACFAQVVVGGEVAAVPAIPVAAVIQDELTKVFYRRDPRNPDKAIRVEADLGVSDGRWVAVNSGLKAGDEVVLEGVYELKLAGGGKPGGAKGHFHADGTWHAEGTPEKK